MTQHNLADGQLAVMIGTTAYQKSFWQGGIDGIGYYTKHLCDQMIQHAEISASLGSHFKVHKNSQLPDVVGLGPFKTQGTRGCIFGLPFPFEERIGAIDLFHSTDHYIPRLSSIPVVATIHDVIPFTFPEWFNVKQRIFHRFLAKTMRWPTHIITVSEYSKREIQKYLGHDAESISVVYNGVSPAWKAQLESVAIKLTLSKYSLDKNYIFFSGTLQERKNLSRLIEAYWALPLSVRNETDLVIAGRMSKNDQSINSKIRDLSASGHLKWLGYVPHDDLILLVQQAKCVAYPSLAEGFGLPMVEAFAAGTPVVASNTTSLPEVAGGAALLVDPYDPRDIAQAISHIILSKDKHDELSHLGRQRAGMFSWERTAQATRRSYEDVVQKGRNALVAGG